MTGKAIDSSARGFLILILPIAFLIILLLKTWPVILALVVLSASWNVWQRYQWQKWCQQVNPIFHQLIQENRGSITALDLAMKANFSATTAKRYLDTKAEEFGVRTPEDEDRGTVYYFITASTLGSIFDDSEPPSQNVNNVWLDPSHSPKGSLGGMMQHETDSPLLSDQNQLTPPENSIERASLEAESISTEWENNQSPAISVPHVPSSSFIPDSDSVTKQAPINYEQSTPESIIQAELAKRLDVHSSTVYKRRSDPDFSEWSRSRDPEGIAWKYSPDTKQFSPLEEES